MSDKGSVVTVPESRIASSRLSGPIHVIGAFLAIIDVAMTLGATRVAGWLQPVMVIFAMAFATALAGVFFWIMIRRLPLLYSPSDYPGGTTIDQLITWTEMQRHYSKHSDITEFVERTRAVRSALSSSEFIRSIDQTLSGSVPIEQRGKVVEEIVQKASAVAEKAVEELVPAGHIGVTYRLGDYEPHYHNMRFDPSMKVQNFVRVIVDNDSALSRHLESFPGDRNYDNPLRITLANFEVVDLATGQVIPMWFRWAAQQGWSMDERTLEQAGLREGMRIELRRPGSLGEAEPNPLKG